MLQVISGARPNRPQGSLDLGLTDGVWTLMQECWDTSDRRWTISRIVSYLESAIAPTAKEVVLGGLESRPTSASKARSGVAHPSRLGKLFHGLDQFFCVSSTQRKTLKTGSWLRKARS